MRRCGQLILIICLCFTLSSCTVNNLVESDEYETEQVEAIEPNVVIPEIIRSVVKQGDEFPDVQKREEMAGKIAELGFSVTRYNQNMLNYEKVDEFLRNVADGIEGEVTVYTYPWIYVISETFSYKNGEMTCTLKHYTADEVREPITLKVDEFEYTERGNFIYRLEESGDEYRGFRVTPLSEKSRTYFQKYIMPGNIFMSGPVNINWNKDNFGDLNWDWIFEKLWEYENGTDMFNTEYYREARDNFHFDYVEIPREVVEELLQKYFYVPTDILRNIDEYNEEDKTYTFEGFRGGGYSPTFEVSKWQENSDGTLTLWIDFVALEFNDELTGQSVLNIKNEDDGSFKYISNENIIYGTSNTKPILTDKKAFYFDLALNMRFDYLPEMLEGEQPDLRSLLLYSSFRYDDYTDLDEMPKEFVEEIAKRNFNIDKIIHSSTKEWNFDGSTYTPTGWGYNNSCFYELTNESSYMKDGKIFYKAVLNNYIFEEYLFDSLDFEPDLDETYSSEIMYVLQKKNDYIKNGLSLIDSIKALIIEEDTEGFTKGKVLTIVYYVDRTSGNVVFTEVDKSK